MTTSEINSCDVFNDEYEACTYELRQAEQKIKGSDVSETIKQILTEFADSRREELEELKARENPSDPSLMSRRSERWKLEWKEKSDIFRKIIDLSLDSKITGKVLAQYYIKKYKMLNQFLFPETLWNDKRFFKVKPETFSGKLKILRNKPKRIKYILNEIGKIIKRKIQGTLQKST